jgi:nucleotide-binding universal stress UspA family protein
MAVLESKQDTAETGNLVVAVAAKTAISVKNVLYATDFSPISDAAFPYAAAIARKFGSTLHIAHIVSDTSLLLMTGGVDYVTFGTLYEDAHSIAKEKVDRVASRLRAIPCKRYVRHGKVWPNLSIIVAENDIDLIVVGTHGRTGVGKMLVGSVAEDILRHAPCPVLTVGPKICGRAKLPVFEDHGGALAPAELELQQILYAANFNPASLQVAPVAVGLAEQFEARLILMHVLENYSNLDSRPGPIEDSVRRLQALVPKDAPLPYAPEIVMEFGSPWQCIVKKAAELDTDLIVLGAQPNDHITHVPWSTVHQVVARASCPVLTVRTSA